MRELALRLQRLIAETRRRGVFKVVAAYAVVAWGASLAASDLMPAFGAPDWAVRAFVIGAVVLGVPVVAALAWIYEITSGGIVRDRGILGLAGTSAEEDSSLSATVLYATTERVRVRWTDAGGPHDQVFFNAFRIGRDDGCELQLVDPLVSRRHAEVRFEDGRWWIEDLQSRNGVRLDGQLVERAPLPPLSSVQLYKAAPELILEVSGASAAETVSSRTGGPHGADVAAARQVEP